MLCPLTCEFKRGEQIIPTPGEEAEESVKAMALASVGSAGEPSEAQRPLLHRSKWQHRYHNPEQDWGVLFSVVAEKKASTGSCETNLPVAARTIS